MERPGVRFWLAMLDRLVGWWEQRQAHRATPLLPLDAGACPDPECRPGTRAR